MAPIRTRKEGIPITPRTTVIVLATLNEEPRISKALATLTRQTQPTKIIVADSHSTDNTQQIAKTWGVEVHDVPRGKLTALDTTLRKLPHDTIAALADADKQYPPTWIANLTRPFHDPNTAMTYGVCDSDTQSPFDPYFWLAPWVEGARNILGCAWGGHSAISVRHYVAAGGYNLAVDQKDFLSTWKAEELDFPRRLERYGKVTLVPNAVVYNSGRRFFPTPDFLKRQAEGVTF